LQALVTREESSRVYKVAPGIAGLRNFLVNLFFIGRRGEPWLLVDTGMPGARGAILRAVKERYGEGARPRAILLTHGHFDHVGALQSLADHWDVPVYAHRMEFPYLAGRSSYPPPDPLAGRGMMSWLSPLYPRGPIDISERLRELPADPSIPGFPEWSWIATPGHSPGHVSYYRERDRVLIAGDAFVTTRQESLLSVLAQRVEMNGPPAYFTCDWDRARDSVQKLAELAPAVMATGHGRPLTGPGATKALSALAAEFDVRIRPRLARYSDRPARTGEMGVVSVPQPRQSRLRSRAAAIAAGFIVFGAVLALARRR
jgi:glyoxylase-like metal-dependent hydrolase (beta-lactamase superfamily II)